ncbi:MAG TPA: DUF1697 domain-containing protein [Pyrinomonadaceae bacterium]
MRYVSLLRGINVGGNTMVKMSELKSTFEKLGFKDVVSYINSGNLAFDAMKTSDDKLTRTIEEAIEKDFGLKIQVMVREQAAIHEVLANNPFEGRFESHKEMHVLFMKDEMVKEKRDELMQKNSDTEQFAVSGREIYALLKQGVAESLLGKGYIEKKLNVPITARNWRTVRKLVEL